MLDELRELAEGNVVITAIKELSIQDNVSRLKLPGEFMRRVEEFLQESLSHRNVQIQVLNNKLQESSFWLRTWGGRHQVITDDHRGWEKFLLENCLMTGTMVYLCYYRDATTQNHRFAVFAV